MTLNTEAGKSFLASLSIYQDEHSDQEDEEWKAAIEQSKALAEATQAAEENDRDIAPLPELPDQIGPYSSDRQGCEMCWTLGLDCILAKDRYAYPCTFCHGNEIDCEPCVSPKWKRACEACKRAKEPCSYEIDDRDHELPCKRCRTAEDFCIAGPERDKPNSTLPAKEIQADSSKSGPPSSPTAPFSNSAGSHVIRTALAHPVNFTYAPPEDGSRPCDWCDQFAYGIVGLGMRTVEVSDPGDGRFLELKGGHVAQGHDPSRMCVTCALERIHIMRCPGHQIVALKGYEAESFDFEAAFGTLAPGQKKINPWCSLCIEPAFYGCAAIQSVNLFQERIDASSPEAVGCGLLLCEKCNMLMKALGDVSRVVANNEARDPDGSRADVCFLLPDNALYRCYLGVGVRSSVGYKEIYHETK
ncbi:hypothetical protein BDV59DRAFT_52662 [Aspergillus ambiguus]|uniref:putative C6 finger domain protein n=1 Tax=Aspergillus ambiguus TaxID=176160 RepID=UPI003CCCC4B3